MEQSRFILDSNVLLALYIENDQLKAAAEVLFEEIEGSEMIIPYCVIEEVCTILTYRVSKKTAVAFLEDIQNADGVLILNDMITEEINFFKNLDAKISFTDSSLLYLSKLWKAELMTFDHQLLKLYKKSKKV
jgi:predicted nucleic acid-binding protein